MRVGSHGQIFCFDLQFSIWVDALWKICETVEILVERERDAHIERQVLEQELDSMV